MLVALLDLAVVVDPANSLNLSDFYNHILASSSCLYFQKSDHIPFYRSYFFIDVNQLIIKQ